MTPTTEKKVIRGVVDIGTNSVKLLIARTDGAVVAPVYEDSVQTRLGAGFYDTGRLQAEAILRTQEVVAGFLAEGRRHEAQSMRILATSAAREAENGAELVRAIHDAGGRLEIIEGSREADLVYAGVASQNALVGLPLLVVDVGGGSTEFIVAEAGKVLASGSFALGTVRQLSRMNLPDPPGDAALATCRESLNSFLVESVVPEILPVIQQMGARPKAVVGTGGTTTFLGMIELATDTFDRDRLERIDFNRAEHEELTRRLWRMSMDERRQLSGLPSNRADVILFGAAIFLAIMDVFELDRLRVSTRGVRFGAMLEN